MTKKNITVVLPKADPTNSVETSVITPTSIAEVVSGEGGIIAVKFDADGNVVKGALANKNNSLFITVENTYTSAKSTMIIKAGNNYPNKILGALNVDLGTATAGAGGAADTPVVTTVILEDISRFENRNGSIEIAFSDNCTGRVWAVAKRAGIEAAADQGAFGTV